MASQNPYVRQHGGLDRCSPRLLDQLITLLDGKEYGDRISNLSDQDAVWLIEYLDKILGTLTPASSAFQGYLRVLGRVCSSRGILPESYVLSSTHLVTSHHPVASGAVADTYEGTFNGSKVRIKRVRVYSNGDPRSVQEFYQEAIMWKHGKHPNIIPFWGVTVTPLQFVSGWTSNGNITEYIKEHPGTDRLHLLHDVTEGLNYLHSRHVVHGGLKGPSILVDNTGRACLTDFGLATVTPDLEPVAPLRKHYSIRWTAPEILDGSVGIRKETDIYSLGMVVIEVFSGAVPFADSTPTSVMAKVLSGERPERPNDPVLTNGLWNLTQRCLDRNPQLRPEITEVVCDLRTVLVDRKGHTGVANVAQIDDATFRSTRHQDSLYRPDCSVLTHRLWERSMPYESLHESGHSLCRVQQTGGLDIHALRDNTSNATFERFRQLYDSYVFSSVGNTEGAKALLEAFDKALQVATYGIAIFKWFRGLYGRTGLLPSSYIIPERFIQTIEHSVATGGFGNIREGIYNDRRVEIKTLHPPKGGDVRKVKKEFCKGVAMRRQISHPNIVPFLGVSGAPAMFSMVSEWMPNGNARDYVVKNPEISRLQLLLDISCGLSFLHSLNIVHGDLKGENILVDKSGCARLSDFGFEADIAILNRAETFASGFKGSHRWMAPELFNIHSGGGSGFSTRESDVFALGMVTFEVFTGQLPFSECKASAIVVRRIVDGERPSRPPKGRKLGLSDEFWEIIRSSLAHEADERPSVSTFVDFLERATPDIAVLKRLTNFDANSEDDVQELHNMFEYGDNTLLGMRENETLVVAEVFDRVLNSSLNDSTLRTRCFRGLQKVSARCGLLPKSYWISHSGLTEPGGAFSDTGRVSSTRQRMFDGKMVAVKIINPGYINNFGVFKRRLCTNAVMWKQLRHPNVVSFLGFGSHSPPFSLVYPWIPNGSLSEYLREHPDVDKLGLLSDVARGLAYLHQHGLVHGNLTGHNILIDNNGIACVSGYGLETLLRDEASSRSIPTNVRWMAPEVLGAKSGHVPSENNGKATDVYSFAMIMFEVLSGTTPFPNESDEEIVDKITRGLRPEWSSANPSQKLANALWEHIEACWNQEPKERPTAFEVLQTLLALGEDKYQVPVASVENAEDDPMVREWEQAEDTPDISPIRKDYEECHRLKGLSGITRVSSPRFPGFMSPHYSPSDTHGHSGSRDRFGKKVEKRVRSFLHLPRHVPGEAVGRRELARNPALGTEIVDQREEEVSVNNGSLSYLVSQPIPEGKVLRKVVITTVSKDQGWSNYPDDHGTYRNSWSWFELSVGSPSQGSGQKWRGEVVRNLHAHSDFKRHTIEIMDGELYEKAKSGDVLTVWALARFPGWRNTVEKVKIRYIVE